MPSRESVEESRVLVLAAIAVDDIPCWSQMLVVGGDVGSPSCAPIRAPLAVYRAERSRQRPSGALRLEWQRQSPNLYDDFHLNWGVQW